MTRTLVWPDGTVYTIVRSSHETAGAELEMEWSLPARGWAPQPHVHPSLTEEYEVLEGSVELLIGRAWRVLRQGDHAANERRLGDLRSSARSSTSRCSSTSTRSTRGRQGGC
jgi:hypothetical protein